MKKLLILFFVLYHCSCSAFIREGDFQIIDEKIKINFDLEKSILFCIDEIKVFKNSSEIIRVGLPREAKVIKILINNENVNFSFKDGVVNILMNNGEKDFTLIINYSVQFVKEFNFKNIDFEDPSSNLISHISKEGVFIGGDVLWYPRFNTKPEKKEITFISDKDFEFITEGKRVDYQKNNHIVKSTWLVNKETRTLPILGGPYTVKVKQSGNLQIFIYSFKENLHWSDKYLDAVEEYIKFYSMLIGPYPYEKFAVVETYLPVGISYQSFTIVSKELMKLPFMIETSLPHEILHSWFGNGVFVDYEGGNWSEGLVTYLADYLMKERKSKKEATEYLKKLTIDYSSIVKNGKDFSLVDFYGRYDLTTRVIGYGKSAMFFHYLRFYMGDEKFFKSLRNFYNRNLFKTASWSDLRNSFTDNNGDEIKILFGQWVERKGIPEISLKNVSKSFNGKEWIIRFSIEQKEPCYLLKLPLKIYGNNGNKIVDENIIVKEKIADFSFKINEEPFEIRINENFDVLRRLQKEEIPATVNSIKSAEKVLLVLYGNYFQENFIERFVKTMGIKNYKVSGNIDDTYDVIVFLGVVEKVKYKDIVIDHNFFEIGNKKYENKNDAIFLVVRDNDKYKAYFQSFSVEGALKISQKITHYGPFSYLIFKDGTNIDKGLIDTDKNQLFFKFR